MYVVMAGMVLTTTLLATACGGGSSGSTPAATSSGGQELPGQARVGTRSVPKLGTILVDGQGHTLYMFVPDRRKKVTCTGRCAGAWPPLAVVKNARPTAGPGVRRSLLGTVSDPEDPMLRVVTYNGWPLYGYGQDAYAGDANGQGLNVDGGYWYVLRPSGSMVRSSAG